MLPLSGKGQIKLADSTPGIARQSRKQLIEERDDLFGTRVRPDVGQSNARSEKSFGAYTGLDSAEARETLDQESSANEQDHRERDFGHDQGVTDAMLSFAARRAAHLQPSTRCSNRHAMHAKQGRDRTQFLWRAK